MNAHLEHIKQLLQNSQLTNSEKQLLQDALADAEKQWAITDFKLDRTEKVKRTTTILLEETIEELEHKRKAVEAQNRELEIESALERVRTVALSMNKPDDMLEVCKTIALQLQLLGVKEIRNVQTAIFYRERGFYMNYEFYAKHDKTLVTETVYTNHEVATAFAEQMFKGKGEIFIRHIKDKEVKDWLAYQKSTNVFIDTYLENATSLSYYWHSLGPVALGISTYIPLNEKELQLFQRFLKVFDLSYRRYLDIEKAAAQAKEAQLEASLERMRAVAMGLRKSDQVISVSEAMYKELTLLGFTNIRNAQIAIKNDAKKSYTVFEYSDHAAGKGEAAYDSSPIVEELYNELGKSTNALYQREFSGKEFEDWRTWRKALNTSVDSRINNATSMCFYLYSMGTGHLGISTFNPITNEQVEVLKRFKKVFELSYQRYSDVAKAEAQSREAQIELALERVRARTMAMQKSDELAETSFILFQQFKNLGEKSDQISIGIFNEAENIMELYSTLYGAQWKDAAKVSMEEPVVMKKIHAAWKEQKRSLIIDLSGEDLRKYNAYRRTLSKIDYNKKRWVIHIAFFSKGMISFSTTEPHETIQLLERFAAVFDGTYTRFLDLQKAEAQAREATIEVSLERVRSRSMAMHKSDELPEISSLLFQQVKELGVTAIQNSIAIVNEGAGFVELSTTVRGSHVLHTLNVPIDEQYVMAKAVTAWKAKQKSLTLQFEGQELKDYNELRNSFLEKKMNFPEDHWIVNIIFFSKGWLSFSTDKNVSDEIIIVLKRFAAVFEQTYTRFLDLQKAEAQAREAKIEMSLERVRSKAMAMHSSNDLLAVITLLSEQFQLLGFKVHSANFNTTYREKDWHLWLYSLGLSIYPEQIKVPYLDHPFFNRTNESLVSGADFSSFVFTKEEKNSFLDHLYTNTVAKYASEDRKKYTYDSPGFAWSVVYLKNTAVTIANYDAEPYSEEENNILRRFGAVFEQTYTRFLDLQKAEAQSRESQIQLALERGRTQSMIMQHSSELDDTLRVFHEQVLSLGINSAFSFLWLPDEEKDQHKFWAAWIEEKDSEPIFKSKAIDYPLDRNEPATAQCLIDWKSSEPVYSYAVPPEGVKGYFAAWQELITGVEKLTPEHFANGLYYIEAFMKYGCFGVMAENDLTADEKKILNRFAIEFERAYTRFLDLQKAEAQAKEAQIEAALERVRSRSMGMQKSEELKEVIKIVYQQLFHLKINLAHAGFVVDYTPGGDWHFWIADEQDIPSKISHPYFESVWADQFNKAKKKGADFFATNLNFEEKNKFYNELLSYIPGLPAASKDFYLNCPGLAASTVLFDNVSLYIENFKGIPYTDEENNMFMRFGKVFQQTYTRFLDLQKAEAQAREAQIEAALEKVRSRTMAMQRSDELAGTAALVFQEFKKLEPQELIQTTIGIYNEEKNEIEFRATDWTGSGDQVNKPAYGSMDEPTLLKPAVTAWRAHKRSVVIELTGEVLEQWTNYRNKMTGTSIATKFDGGRRIISIAFFSRGHLSMSSPLPIPAEAVKTLERFAAVFDGTYTRFLDLQKAEAQARQAKIEAAMEKVRSRAMAMQKPDELVEVAQTLRKEMGLLGVEELETSSIYIHHEDTGKTECWYAIQKENKLVADHMTIDLKDTRVGREMLAFYGSDKKQTSIVMQGEARKEWINYCAANSSELLGFYGDNIPDRTYHLYKFANGYMGAASPGDISAESRDLLQRATSVFSLAYTRFSDLQQAEAQAREAKIEASLEKVRSRTLAMQKSDELAETAAVLFRQLIALGIAPNRLYITIINEATDEADFWITDEDGSKITAAYTASLNANSTFNKMYEGWKQQLKELVIDMHGEELQKYFQYLQSINVPFKGGLDQTRRVQHLAYFSKGFIGMASPDEQPEETLQVLERFAAVFNLTFTRFNDLKVAEAHAIQAEEDLIKLQTEKKRAEDALTELRATQTQLIQSEKMASLGELTAGIAHEIQNPLNFVNNFSEVSNELIDELQEERNKPQGTRDEALENDILNDIRQNLEKINHHGKRADAIVKGMLQHSRSTSATKELTDINKLADEYLRLAYHGLRAKDKSFNATLKTDYDETLQQVNIIPQDIGRVILNLITNAFYAVQQKQKEVVTQGKSSFENLTSLYEPTVSVSTKKVADKILIAVTDNGNGIPQTIVDKIFQPFFTTKPTGQGTGLGLSLSYDIVKAHGGELKVETKGGEGSTFIIQLPTN